MARQRRSTPARPFPAFIPPMLADAARPFDSPDFLFEIKWDGTRAVVLRAADELRLVNRRKVQLLARYPEFTALERLPPETALDGEIVVLTDGKPSFERLMQREHLTDARTIAMAAERLPATLIVFDLMFLGGVDRMAQPLAERKQALQSLVGELGVPCVVYCDHVIEHGKQYFQAAEQMALEGVMAKRLASRYRPGKRSGDWLKVKVARTESFALLGFTQRAGARMVSALVVGHQRADGCVFKAKVGSGFNEPLRAALFEQLAPLPPLADPPVDGPADAHWRRTGLLCRVRYAEETSSGKLRAPVFQGLHAADDSDDT